MKFQISHRHVEKEHFFEIIIFLKNEKNKSKFDENYEILPPPPRPPLKKNLIFKLMIQYLQEHRSRKNVHEYRMSGNNKKQYTYP